MKSTLKVFMAITLIAIALFSSCTSTPEVSGKDAEGIKIISYIRTWPLGSDVEDMMKGNFWKAEDIKGEKLTTLNIAFGHIVNETDIHIQDLSDSEEGMPGFKNFFEELEKVQQQNPNLRINLSVGGWGAGGFSEMAMTKENRTAFIANAMDWIEKYGFDGIDIDWEYPVNGGWGTISSAPEDKENFTFLMQELRVALDELGEKLGKKLELSFAAMAGPAYLDWIEPLKVAEVVDYAKIMCYDFYGSWNDSTGHLANLHKSSLKPDDVSVASSVEGFLAAGFPASKLILGVPFYGRGWKGVGSENNGLYQKAEEAIYVDGVTYPDIKKLIASGEYTRYWDDEAKAPYLYNGDVWVTYEDAESLKAKMDFIKEKGLRGIMVWEYAHDMGTELFDALNEAKE